MTLRLLGRRDVQKEKSLSRKAYTSLELGTAPVTYIDSLNLKLVSTLQVASSSLRNANHLNIKYDYVATFLTKLLRAHTPFQAIYRTLDRTTILHASMTSHYSRVRLKLAYKDKSHLAKGVCKTIGYT